MIGRNIMVIIGAISVHITSYPACFKIEYYTDNWGTTIILLGKVRLLIPSKSRKLSWKSQKQNGN
jgi:hypothetical protein